MVMWISPAGGGGGSAMGAGDDCFFSRLERRGLRLRYTTAGAPDAAGDASGAAAATGGRAGDGAAAAGDFGCASKEKLECLGPRETQTIVLAPSSELVGEEASPEARATKRWTRAALAEDAADWEDAGGEDSGGFFSGAGGEGSRVEAANRPPSREVMGRRGCC